MKEVNRPLNLESVIEHRREHCIHYDGCLDEASALLWQSFSCDGCSLFCERIVEPVYYERAVSPLGWEI